MAPPDPARAAAAEDGWGMLWTSSREEGVHGRGVPALGECYHDGGLKKKGLEPLAPPPETSRWGAPLLPRKCLYTCVQSRNLHAAPRAGTQCYEGEAVSLLAKGLTRRGRRGPKVRYAIRTPLPPKKPSSPTPAPAVPIPKRWYLFHWRAPPLYPRRDGLGDGSNGAPAQATPQCMPHHGFSRRLFKRFGIPKELCAGGKKPHQPESRGFFPDRVCG
ncbi:hypothetical protein GWK47_029775 [Chionoecetes opilio]|uniref:Uncharacterized protein n=1 Tax=Chionoecetes opilio TaxID=41210 RepID=A0A8J5CRD4_CHIOP|nr:hypothetical protein GWK47_029775 [Chionoecetes opilio]